MHLIFPSDVLASYKTWFYGYMCSLTLEDGKQEEIKHVKNVLCCEAHNEVVTNTMNMIYFDRMEKAKAKEDFLRKLRNMEIPEE